MSRLKEALETGKFGVTAEMAPPKGYDFTEQLEAGKLLAPKVHAVNVTDMQSASLKASSLGLCIALKNAGVEPILQMTGRDRNRMAIICLRRASASTRFSRSPATIRSWATARTQSLYMISIPSAF